MMVIYSKVSCL